MSVPDGARDPQAPPISGRAWFLGLVLFLTAANLWWTYGGGGGPQHWDSAIHLSESLGANRVFESPQGVSLRSLLNVSWYYPPLVSYVAIPFYRIFGESESAGYLVQTFFLLLLVTSVFLTGQRFWGPFAGFIAALIISALPIVIEYSRVFMLDLPLAAMAALCVLCLVASDGFRRPAWGLAAGVALGLGELTKWTFAAFVISPLVFSCVEAFRARDTRRKSLLTMACSALLAVAVCAPWYSVHIVQILTSRAGELGRGDYTLLQSVFLYLVEIPGEASWWGAALLAGGIASFVLFDRERRLYLGLWFISAYALISTAGIKAPRLALSLLIPAALMSGRGAEILFSRLRPGDVILRRLLIGAFGLIAAQLIVGSVVPLVSPFGRLLSSNFLGVPILRVQGANGQKWDNSPALEVIAADMHRSGKATAVVRVIPDHPYFNNSTASYYAQLHRLLVRISGTSGFPTFTDYVLLKSGDIGIDSPDRHRTRLSGEVLGGAGSDSSAYHVIDSLPLPDGSSAIVVKVVPVPVPPAEARSVIAAVRASSGSMVSRYFRPVSGYRIDVREYDGVRTSEGRIAAIRIRMDSAAFGDFAFNDRGIAVSGLDIEVRDLLIDPRSAMRDTTLKIFAMRSLSVNGFCLRASDIASYLAKGQSRDVRITGISVGGGVISLSAMIVRYDMPVELGIALEPAGTSNIRFAFTHARIGRLPVPAFLLNLLTDSYNPVVRGLDVLGEVDLAPLRLEDGKMTIGTVNAGPVQSPGLSFLQDRLQAYPYITF